MLHRFEPLESRLLLALTVPALHTRASAPNNLYLDFDGDIARTWRGQAVSATPPLDVDGNLTSFNTIELGVIRETHSRVADIFSPFNVDVTTVAPPQNEQSRTLRVVIGENTSFPGLAGTAQRNNFGTAENWVYVLYDWPASALANTIAHEAGHGLGLAHHISLNPDGTVKPGIKVNPHDTSPIMGVVSPGQRGLWWDGPIMATTRQSDVDVIASVLGYAPDDHGNSTSSARFLSINGGVFSTTGVLHHHTDVDTFAFDLPGGPVTIMLDPSKHARTLDAVIELRSGAGGAQLVGRSDLDEPREFISLLNVPAGRYYLFVRAGQHLDDDTLTSYGEMGQYTLRGVMGMNNPQLPWNGTPLKVSATSATTLQAEDFDLGGYNISYLSPANVYRNGPHRTYEAIRVGFEPATGLFLDGNFAKPGVWVEYTIDVAAAGKYDLSLRLRALSHAPNGRMHLEVDGVNVTGTLSFPAAVQSPPWTTIQHPGVALTAGRHVLRVRFDSVANLGAGVGDVDWIRFTPVKPPVSASIAGVVFSDADRDGVLDASEPRLAARRMWLDLDRDGARDAGEPSVLSAADGSYKFSNLTAAAYRVRRADTPAGYVLTVPASGYHDVILVAGQQVTGKHFGAALSVSGNIVRINAGGGNYRDVVGNAWSADSGFAGGTARNSVYDVVNAADDPLLATRRFGADFTFRKAVANGTYRLNLLFADPTATTGGARTFNVFAEGMQILADFDIVAAAGGGKRAVGRTFNVTVVDGAIDLRFVATRDNALISAIELLPA